MLHRLDIAPPEPLTKAAVLVPVLDTSNGLSLILTLRTQTVSHHKGQISFPGGMAEKSDTSLWHTATRETHEEIGLPASKLLYVKKLPSLITPTAFEVTPFVAFVHDAENLVPNPDEIETILTVPLSVFRDPTNLHVESRIYFDKSYPVPFFTYGPHQIWGATGRIILSMLEIWK